MECFQDVFERSGKSRLEAHRNNVYFRKLLIRSGCPDRCLEQERMGRLCDQTPGFRQRLSDEPFSTLRSEKPQKGPRGLSKSKRKINDSTFCERDPLRRRMVLSLL